MKALCCYEHGDLDVLQYADVPEPGEVLVQVKACALITWTYGCREAGRA